MVRYLLGWESRSFLVISAPSLYHRIHLVTSEKLKECRKPIRKHRRKNVFHLRIWIWNQSKWTWKASRKRSRPSRPGRSTAASRSTRPSSTANWSMKATSASSRLSGQSQLLVVGYDNRDYKKDFNWKLRRCEISKTIKKPITNLRSLKAKLPQQKLVVTSCKNCLKFFLCARS